MELENNTILVTGADSGIRKELTLTLLKKNSKVVVVDLRQELLDALNERSATIKIYLLRD